MIWKDAYFLYNSVDLSGWVSEITPGFDVESQDDTVMGDDARSSAPGLESNQLSVTFKNPWASSGPDASIFPNRSTVVAMAVKPVNTTIAATNPEYQFSGWVSGYSFGGGVGEEGTLTCTINITTVITRDVTA